MLLSVSGFKKKVSRKKKVEAYAEICTHSTKSGAKCVCSSGKLAKVEQYYLLDVCALVTREKGI